MKDPLTALMYAVQVMKLLKSLTEKTLREREVTSSQVDTICSNEAKDGEKKEDNEDEDDEEEEEEEEEEEDEEGNGDIVYIIEEEKVSERKRVVADDHPKSESMKNPLEGSITSDAKGADGVVQPLICNPNHIESK